MTPKAKKPAPPSKSPALISKPKKRNKKSSSPQKKQKQAETDDEVEVSDLWKHFEIISASRRKSEYDHLRWKPHNALAPHPCGSCAPAPDPVDTHCRASRGLRVDFPVRPAHRSPRWYEVGHPRVSSWAWHCWHSSRSAAGLRRCHRVGRCGWHACSSRGATSCALSSSLFTCLFLVWILVARAATPGLLCPMP